MSTATPRERYILKSRDAGASGMTTTVSGTSSVHTASVARDSRNKAARRPSSDDIEKSVYSYLRAIRVLRKNTATTIQIAEALGLPVSAVDAAVRNLTTRGIKIK